MVCIGVMITINGIGGVFFFLSLGFGVLTGSGLRKFCSGSSGEKRLGDVQVGVFLLTVLGYNASCERSFWCEVCRMHSKGV